MRLHLLLPLVLLPASLLGELTRRIGITALVGEITVGVLLGPAVANLLPARGAPGVFHELAHIGFCALLFRLGMQSRPETLFSAWRPGLLVGLVGMVVSFTLGGAVSVAFGWRLDSAAFVGAALTATSISVPVSVLREARHERSRAGSIVLAAAFVTDLLGLAGLAFLTAFFASGSPTYGQVLRVVAQSVAFLAAGVVLGPFAIRQLVRVARRFGHPTLLLVLGFSYLLLVAHAAKAVGLAMVIGAYAAGLAFSGLEERERLEAEIRPLILLLRPLFFVLAGASISLSTLSPAHPAGRVVIALTATLIVIAVLGKLVGPSLSRIDRLERRVVGYGMVARGGMGFVFAEAGIASGKLPPELFAAVALTLTATTVVGAVGLRTSLSHAAAAGSRSPTSA